jgi:hypothetical protein
MTAPMQARIADTFISFDEVLARVDAANVPANVRGPYEKGANWRSASGY